MKKLVLLCLSLLLVTVACDKNDSPLSSPDEAALKSADTKTYQWKTETGYFTPLLCDGELMDYLEGDLAAHYRWNIRNGEDKWVLITFIGELSSTRTGETFKIMEQDKIKFVEGQMMHYAVSWNIKGDWGNHYVGSGYVDLDTWEVVPDKAMCPGMDE